MTTVTKTLLETKTMTKRNLIKSIKNPDKIYGNIIGPVMTMLIFVFIMGGAMGYVVDFNYTNFVVPAVLLVTIGQCAAATAVGISTEMQEGVVDRFRSMPITIFSFLNGQVFESVIRTIFSFIITLIAGFIVGFRPEAGVLAWLGALGILLLFTVTITWASIVAGLMAKDPEGAGGSIMLILLFTYLSSGFIPTETLPLAVRAFAENQPVTFVIESVRRLLLNQPLEGHVPIAILWCVGVLVVSYIAGVMLYKRKVMK
jgi:ABC-2 type transport system permease protein